MHISIGGVIFASVVMLLVYAWETLKWRRKPIAALEQMVTGRDYLKWKMGLQQLKRRGEDIDRFVPLLLSRMLVEKRMRREAARIVLSDMYPQLRPDLKGYSSGDDPGVSREKLAPLLARYPIPDPAETDLSETGFVL
jgi:hypothetical protein